MAQKKSTNDLSKAQKVGIGFGLTAAAVTAAGAYFLYGSKKATQNRKKVKGWMLKAKGEVLETLEKAESITEDEYKALVETLGRSLVPLAVRFGDPVVQEINAWATQTSDPDLRALVARVTVGA